MEEKKNAAQAFSSFAKQLDRFVASGETELPAGNGTKATVQSLIRESEEERRKSIAAAYRAFLKPKDQETADDEEQLLCAYRLSSAAQELNRTAGNRRTFLQSTAVSSPLAKKARYAGGTELVCLQCWFEKEGAKAAVVPEIRRAGESSVLVFVPEDEHTWSPREREIREIIQETFYS